MSLRKLPIACGFASLVVAFVTLFTARPFLSDEAFVALATGAIVVIGLPLIGIATHWWVNDALVGGGVSSRPEPGSNYPRHGD